MIVSILVSANDLTIALGKSWTTIDLNDYIAYKLKPYLNLRIFSYYDFNVFFHRLTGGLCPHI